MGFRKTGRSIQGETLAVPRHARGWWLAIPVHVKATCCIVRWVPGCLENGCPENPFCQGVTENRPLSYQSRSSYFTLTVTVTYFVAALQSAVLAAVILTLAL